MDNILQGVLAAYPSKQSKQTISDTTLAESQDIQVQSTEIEMPRVHDPETTDLPINVDNKSVTGLNNETSVDKGISEKNDAAVNKTVLEQVQVTLGTGTTSEKTVEVLKDPVIEGKMLEAIGKARVVIQKISNSRKLFSFRASKIKCPDKNFIVGTFNQ